MRCWALEHLNRYSRPARAPAPCAALFCPAAACPPKGYTAHILGYTVHAVVEAVTKVGAPSCLDDSLLMILPLMEVGKGGGGWVDGSADCLPRSPA